jgi:parallel beta-helix repeat protein
MRHALLGFSLLSLLALLTGAAPAAAANPACGSTLAGLTVLTSNVTCPASGYTLVSGATLDCASFLLSGPDPLPASCENPATPGCTTGHYGLRVNGASGVTIRNCKVRFFERGLYATNMDNSLVEGNRFQSNTRYGAQLSNDSSGNLFQDNHHRQNRDEGFHISDLTPGAPPNTVLRDQAYENASEGFYLLQAHGVILTDIQAANNGLPGIYHKNTRGTTITNATITNDNVNLLNDTGLPWVIDKLAVAP